MASDPYLQYPAVYNLYRSYCVPRDLSETELAAYQQQIVGTCFLAVARRRYDEKEEKDMRSDMCHYIACLITSERYGKQKSDAATILANTRESIRHLKRQLDFEGLSNALVYAVRINSGSFRVPWNGTMEVLKNEQINMTVVRCPDEYVPQVTNETWYNYARSITAVRNAPKPPTQIESGAASAETHDDNTHSGPSESRPVSVFPAPVFMAPVLPAPASSAPTFPAAPVLPPLVFPPPTLPPPTLPPLFEPAYEEDNYLPRDYFAYEPQNEPEAAAAGPSTRPGEKRARSVSPSAQQATKHQRTSAEDEEEEPEWTEFLQDMYNLFE